MRHLRAVTLNIWNRQGDWFERLKRIRQGIQEYAPDIVALQEVMQFQGVSQADEIGKDLGYEIGFGKAHDLAGAEFGNAILSRWPLQNMSVFPLVTMEAEEKRCLLFAEVLSPFGIIPVFATHLSWKFDEGYIREAQVKQLSLHVHTLAPNSGLPPVIMGDLNAQPESTEIRFLRGLHSLGGRSCYWVDCFGEVGVGPGITFDPQKNAYAAPTREPSRRIDYVFVRGPDALGRGKVIHSRVVFDVSDDDIFASDHYGVLADIQMERA